MNEIISNAIGEICTVVTNYESLQELTLLDADSDFLLFRHKPSKTINIVAVSDIKRIQFEDEEEEHVN